MRAIFGCCVSCVAFLAMALVSVAHAANQKAVPIIQDGRPVAQIVIAAENRPRMVTLAALELRRGVEKISGGRLPIFTRPGAGLPVKIYVGQSPATDALGVTADGLQYGAYRIVSGPDWIVLLGHDSDFDPVRYPMPLSRGDAKRATAEWERAGTARGKTDSGWASPFGSGYKGLWSPNDFNDILTEQYGADSASLWTNGGNTVRGFWNQDAAGSLNAVYALLRQFGARWFMPGELGEVVPKTVSIEAGPFDELVKPDYAVRAWTWYNYSSFGFDDVMWARRIGMNSGFAYLGPSLGIHGLVAVHRTEAMRTTHPEYYALIGGKRDTEHRDRGTACYSSKGLEQEAVNYIRFVFDEYDLPHIGIWPGDGLKHCQCEGCKDKTASEMVWEFADRVAREVYKTHPNKLITCGAYTSYIDAPDTIAMFSPNLAVLISNSGRPKMMEADHWAQYWARVEKWQSKMAPGHILRSENNRYHIWGEADGVRGLPISYPVIFPRATARELKALKGISSGEFGEQSQFRGEWKVIGLEHINLYVQSRFLWDADLDVDQVLDEYCRMFYGPAAKQMKAAIDFAEKNIAVKDESRGRGRGNPMNVPLATALKLRGLLDAAKAAAGDNVYGQRVQAVIADLQSREDVIAKYKKIEKDLAQARANAPVAIGVEGSALTGATAYTLTALRGSEKPAVETSFKVGWDNEALLLDIVCAEPGIDKLVIADDVDSGDYVAVSLSTPNHSYYHMEINPDGAIVEGDPTAGWKSLAEVKAKKGTDFWRIQLRIPVVGDAEAEADPNHRVAGSKPTAADPWYFNVGRQRVAGLETPEPQAFSPTGGGWHVPAKFGKLVMP